MEKFKEILPFKIFFNFYKYVNNSVEYLDKPFKLKLSSCRIDFYSFSFWVTLPLPKMLESSVEKLKL